MRRKEFLGTLKPVRKSDNVAKMFECTIELLHPSRQRDAIPNLWVVNRHNFAPGIKEGDALEINDWRVDGKRYTFNVTLIGKPTGKIALPEDLMNEEWLSELSPDQYRAYIINGWIDTMNQYKEAARKRRVNIAWIVVFFGCASLLFAIGVGIS